MSYYNYVYVIFGIGGETPVDYRTAGQMLPRGAVPLCIINANSKIYSEVINSISPLDAFKFLAEKIFSGEWEDEESKQELKDEINGTYTIIGSTSSGWGFKIGDSLEVKV
jgi:hypothetical protein